jgi:outer membrane biosynthesis protein TonB
MLRGFAISTLVHASVLAAAMLSWPQEASDCDKAIAKLRRESPGIRTIEIVMQLPECATSTDLPIDFEDVGLVSNVSELRKTPEPDAAPPLAEPEAAETPPEPPPVETPSAPEDEVLVPDPRVKPQPAPKPEPKKEPPPKKTEPLIKKAPTPKKEDDLAFLDDVDKVLKDKRKSAPRAVQEASDRPALGNADRDREGAGDRSANTASLSAYVRKELRSFWADTQDLPKEDQIEVTIRLHLNRDGTLAEPPQLVKPGSRPVGRKGIAVDRALGAARKFFAERRLNLPEDDYDKWQQIDVDFGRAMMNENE